MARRKSERKRNNESESERKSKIKAKSKSKIPQSAFRALIGRRIIMKISNETQIEHDNHLNDDGGNQW